MSKVADRLTSSDLARLAHVAFVSEAMEVTGRIRKAVPQESFRVEWWGGKGWEHDVTSCDLACLVGVLDASRRETIRQELVSFLGREAQCVELRELSSECFVLRPKIELYDD